MTNMCGLRLILVFDPRLFQHVRSATDLSFCPMPILGNVAIPPPKPPLLGFCSVNNKGKLKRHPQLT